MTDIGLQDGTGWVQGIQLLISEVLTEVEGPIVMTVGPWRE